MELVTWIILKLWILKICSHELYLSCSMRGTMQWPSVETLSFGHMLRAASHVSSNILKTLSSLIYHWGGGFYCRQEDGGCSLGFPFGSHLEAFWTYLQAFAVFIWCSHNLHLERQIVKMHEMVPWLLPWIGSRSIWGETKDSRLWCCSSSLWR